MSRCALRRSTRNRVLIALLPLARWLFRAQDVAYALLGRSRWGIPDRPPPISPEQAAPTALERGFVRNRHGNRQFYRLWPPSAPEARAVLIAMDGLGSHAEQFHPAGPVLAARDIAFVGLDLQGQGLSDGPRGDLTCLDQIVDGVADTIDFFQERYPGRPIYLLGESLGAPIAMRVATRLPLPARLAGLILASPELEPTQLTAPGSGSVLAIVLGQIPYLLLWSRAPSVDISGRERLVARGPAIYEQSVRDPLRSNHVTVRTIVKAFELIVQSPEVAQRLTLPTLVLQAECDLVDDPRAASAFLECLATGDKELVYFPGAAHGLFYDPDTPDVLDVIAHWLERRLARWNAPVQRCAPAAENERPASNRGEAA